MLPLPLEPMCTHAYTYTVLAIDWELRYGVSESLAGPSSASPSPTPAFHLQNQQQLQEEERNTAAIAAAAAVAASAVGPSRVYLHAFPTTERQPSPPRPSSISAPQRTCEHCEEQPASMACPACNDAAYCVECDTVRESSFCSSLLHTCVHACRALYTSDLPAR